MRNFVFMICGIILGGLLIGNLAACSAPSGGGDAAGAAVQAAAPLDAAEPLPEAARQAYAALLREVLAQQTLPDGTELDHAGTEHLDWNDFALYDLDGNGVGELILNWVNASTAGRMEVVFTYDQSSGEVRELLRAYPGAVFYSSGTVESPWRHNQGLAGRFWPYDLYQFRQESGVYEAVGAADAWDKEYRPNDFSGNPFPDSADRDGDGLLYYLLPPDWAEAESPSFYDTFVDGPEYERWRGQYTGGAEVLALGMMSLTEENIAAALESSEPYGVPVESSRNSVPAASVQDGSPAAPVQDGVPAASGQDSVPAAAGQDSVPAASGQDGSPAASVLSGIPAAYARAIETYCRTGVFPDGDGGEIPTRISYAVYDVDGDGKDELILQNKDTIMAGRSERIYDMDGDTLRRQLEEFSALVYYDNGVIRADWSHNQGRAGSFWPYTLYQYQPESDRYQPVGGVDAWDKSLTDDGFPTDIDADGDGFVYYLLPAQWSGNYSAPVDGPVYEAWRDSFLSGASPMEIPYQTLEIQTVFPDAAG